MLSPGKDKLMGGRSNPAWPFFCHYRERGFLWLRILGCGFKIKDVRRHRLLFSEREGLCWGFRIGYLHFSWLPYVESR